MNTSGTKTTGLIGSIAALVLQYGVFAIALILVVLALIFSGIDDGRGFRATDAQGCVDVTLWGAALALPTLVIAFVRKGRFKIAFAAIAVVPPVTMLLIAGIFGATAARLSVPPFTGVITADKTIGTHTIPAGSTLGSNGFDTTVTLPAGATYDGVPIKGTFVINRDGNVSPIGPYAIAHDVTVDGVSCSARATVTYSVGKIESCTLVPGSTIDGVPCASDRPAQFEGEAGGRAICTIVASWTAHGVVWPAGTNINLVDHWYWIGNTAPAGLRFFGKPLTKGALIALFPGTAQITIDVNSRKWYCQEVTGGTCAATDTKIHENDLTIDGKPLVETI